MSPFCRRRPWRSHLAAFLPLACVSLVAIAALFPLSAKPKAQPITEPGLWTEVNVESDLSHDRLLIGLVDPLVHKQLVGELSSWHFFWEPQLRLRLLWKSEQAKRAGTRALSAALADAEWRGFVSDWHSGGNGYPGQVYRREAAEYSPALWAVVYRDWESGSEYALQLAKEADAGTLSHPRTHYFDRRLHLFANEAYGGYELEVGLSVCHALGYARLVAEQAHGDEHDHYTTLSAAEADSAVRELERVTALWPSSSC